MTDTPGKADSPMKPPPPNPGVPSKRSLPRPASRPDAEATISCDMKLRERLSLAWRILRSRHVQFTVKGTQL